jgi:hypothetical protein
MCPIGGRRVVDGADRQKQPVWEATSIHHIIAVAFTGSDREAHRLARAHRVTVLPRRDKS